MDNYQHNEPPDSAPPPLPSGTFPPGQYPPYAPPPPPEDMGTGKVIGLSALACCIPLIGPIISLIIGIIERAKRGAVVVIVIAGISLLGLPVYGIVAAIAIPVMLGGTSGSVLTVTETKTMENMNVMWSALERFAVDNHGKYPEDIDILVEMGYLDEIPVNQFSGTPMIAVGKDDPPIPKEGNFTYIPRYLDEDVMGFQLLGYGLAYKDYNTYDDRADMIQVLYWMEAEAPGMGEGTQ